MQFSIYRYNPETDRRPTMQSMSLEDPPPGTMVLGALHQLKAQDETLTYRHSCQHGVCGSDGLNINGRNRLACTTPLASLSEPITIRPLPGQPVIRDLVVDLDNFYRQYRAAEPWLEAGAPPATGERLQSPQDQERLLGLVECIMCGCCSAACPSFWWNPGRFLGPAALLHAARFVEDSRDEATDHRLDTLNDAYRLYRCHTIMNCAQVCPKGLNPTKAIGTIRARIAREAV